MIWMLVGYLIVSQPSGGLFIPGAAYSSARIELFMPSEDVCETVRAANKNISLQCWGQRSGEPKP